MTSDDSTLIKLSGPDGSSASITLFGAHVTSFESKLTWLQVVRAFSESELKELN